MKKHSQKSQQQNNKYLGRQMPQHNQGILCINIFLITKLHNFLNISIWNKNCVCMCMCVYKYQHLKIIHWPAKKVLLQMVLKKMIMSWKIKDVQNINHAYFQWHKFIHICKITKTGKNKKNHFKCCWSEYDRAVIY